MRYPKTLDVALVAIPAAYASAVLADSLKSRDQVLPPRREEALLRDLPPQDLVPAL